MQSLQAYGLRFEIEENILEGKSKGLQLESSLMWSSEALSSASWVPRARAPQGVCGGEVGKEHFSIMRALNGKRGRIVTAASHKKVTEGNGPAICRRAPRLLGT